MAQLPVGRGYFPYRGTPHVAPDRGFRRGPATLSGRRPETHHPIARCLAWRLAVRPTAMHSDDTVSQHRIRDLDETGDIGPLDVVAVPGVAATTVLNALLVNAFHD